MAAYNVEKYTKDGCICMCEHIVQIHVLVVVLFTAIGYQHINTESRFDWWKFGFYFQLPIRLKIKHT